MYSNSIGLKYTFVTEIFNVYTKFDISKLCQLWYMHFINRIAIQRQAF